MKNFIIHIILTICLIAVLIMSLIDLKNNYQQFKNINQTKIIKQFNQ